MLKKEFVDKPEALRNRFCCFVPWNSVSRSDLIVYSLLNIFLRWMLRITRNKLRFEIRFRYAYEKSCHPSIDPP